MKSLFKYTLTLSAIIFLSGTPVKERQPNIIFILTDDMGYGDIGCFGGKFIPTPNIDRLAKSGMMLTRYYSAAPICSPSRAGFLTGMYPAKWNFSTYLDNRKHNKNAQQADYLDPQAPSIGRFFKNAGYKTAHIGKWHMGGGRDVDDAPGFKAYGFDEHASTYESPEPDPLLTATNWIWSDKDSIKRWNRTQYFVDKTLGFIQRHKGTPCYINLWPDDVHTPWVPNPDDNYNGAFPRNREEEAAFKLVLQEYDKQIGRLLDGLKAMGEDENTIIIFTSDNGPLPNFRSDRSGGMRGSKLSLYEGGVRMPYIISWPGHIKAGAVNNNSAVTAIDLLPSLAKMASVPLPKNYRSDGTDRSGVFMGKATERGKDMFWEYGRNNIAFNYPKAVNKSPNLAMQSGQWKLLMNHDGTGVELYDVVKDRDEKMNVAEGNPQVVAKMKKKLAAWWEALPKRV